MQVSRIRALRGPNLWSRHTALEAIVSCEGAEADIRQTPDVSARLAQLLHGVPGWSAPASAAPASAALVSLAHVLQAVTLALQVGASCPVHFSRTTPTVQVGTYQVVVEYAEEAVGRLALAMAQAVIGWASNHGAPDFDLRGAISQLQALYEDERLGPSTGAIVDAALARGIPYRRLTQGSLVQFGWGSRQRRIQAAEVDSTSAIAEAIAQDKDLTKKLLHAAGVPVPLGGPVATPEAAWTLAVSLGLPVVVKPQDGNQGKGVSVNLATEAQVRTAFAAAAVHGVVMVERFLPGSDFRLLVVGEQLVAASRREPPYVLGDGVHSVRALVELVNQDPLRGDGHATPLTKIRFDEIALALLATQQLSPDSIPSAAQRVVLRSNANLSTGGTAADVTHEVHPSIAAHAIAAAQMIGLAICGVDVVCENVHVPLEEQRGGVVEVNAAPGLRMHLSPSHGQAQPVGAAVIAELFADADNGRIPVVAVTGTNGKTTTTRLIAHLLSAHGWRTGMTNTDGVWVDGRQTDTGDCSGPKSARNVLMHPDVDAAVFEVARGGVLREGLGFDRCDVAVVTNLGDGDHLGLNYITTVQDLAVLKRVIVQNVSATGYAVLNAADPLVADMAPSCPGQVIFFAADCQHPIMAAHRTHGRPLVYIQDGMLVAAEGDWAERISLHGIPLTHGGAIAFQVENVMAAVAAAWALGISWEVIRQGVTGFANDTHNAPGRFNVMNYHGATVIADYGHNPDAMRALVAAVNAMPAPAGQRRSVVISGAGDRRDKDIRDQTIILGAAFDDVILYQDAAQRGRADGEVIALLREGLEGPFKPSRTRYIEEVSGEFRAIDTALARLAPGDLCLVLVDQVQEALEHLAAHVGTPWFKEAA